MCRVVRDEQSAIDGGDHDTRRVFVNTQQSSSRPVSFFPCSCTSVSLWVFLLSILSFISFLYSTRWLVGSLAGSWREGSQQKPPDGFLCDHREQRTGFHLVPWALRCKLNREVGLSCRIFIDPRNTNVPNSIKDSIFKIPTTPIYL